MTPDQAPPRVLRWADTAIAQRTTTVVALVTMVAAVTLGVRQSALQSCLAETQRADATRTKAIAVATDAERAAQRKLLAARTPTEGRALRADVIATYDHTDAVRAANPAPAPGRC